jgi:hypothetical protein
MSLTGLERGKRMPKYVVTWTTNAEVIDAKNEDEARQIARALVADGLAFQEYVNAPIISVEPASEAWTRKDAELGSE